MSDEQIQQSVATPAVDVVGASRATAIAVGSATAVGKATAATVDGVAVDGVAVDKVTIDKALVVDKALVARRFARARLTYDGEAHVQRQVGERMLRLLTDVLLEQGVAPSGLATRFRHIVELGCGPGTLSRRLCQTFHPDTVVLNDLCPEMEESLHDLITPPAVAPQSGEAKTLALPESSGETSCRPPRVRFVPGDAETLALPEGTDLVVSCSTLQWFAAPEAFLRRCQQALAPGGWLAVSTFGPDNLREIRTLTGDGLAYSDLDALRAQLAAAGFARVHGEEERLTLWFDSPAAVLRHLKLTGATAGSGRRPWTRGQLAAFCRDYATRYGQGGGKGSVSLTFHPIYLLAQKPPADRA